jgi:hypothetical protein
LGFTRSEEFKSVLGFDGEFCGSVPRHVSFESKEFINHDYINFCKESRYVDVPMSLWRIPEMSCAASYAECSKYFVHERVKPLRPDIKNKAFECAIKHFGFALKDAKPMSYEEAVNDMDPTGSCGYPYNLVFGCKREIIVLNNGEDLFRLWNIFYRSLQTSNPMPELFMNQQKWELRKVGKAARTFMPGPLLLHITCVMLFGNQNKALVKNFQWIWPKVGISQFHGGWNTLYENLLEHGDTFFESDFSGWDRSVSAELLWMSYQLRISCWPKEACTRENLRAAYMCYQLLIHSFIVLENGEIVRKRRGVCSGGYSTVENNGIIHAIVLFYCLLLMADEKKVPLSYDEIMFAFNMCLYGDDNLGSINFEYVSRWFSFERLQEVLLTLGFTLKTIKHSSKLDEREFLSHHFRRRCGLICAMPDHMKVHCQIAFGNQKRDPKYMYVRLLGLLINVWPDSKLYAHMSAYADRFFAAHKSDIMVEGGVLPWSMIRPQIVPESVIMRLHLGVE